MSHICKHISSVAFIGDFRKAINLPTALHPLLHLQYTGSVKKETKKNLCMQRCEIPVSPHKLWKLQRKLTPQEMLVKIGTGLSSNWKNLNSASHTNKYNTHTHTLLNFHNDPRVINSLITFSFKIVNRHPN